MPTAIPANTTRTQLRGSSSLTRSPSATKQQAKQTSCEATPQQAAEKNPVFNAAANAPSTLAMLERPSLRKQNAAARPSMSKVNGA